MKKIALLIAAISFTAILFAQEQTTTQTPPAQNISWKEVEHNFGTIKEEDGPQTYKFEFTNKGTEPLFITNVQASCGCTATDYTKEPVKAGEKGYVSATYNPQNRPGQFNKSITVTTSEPQPTTVLRFSGVVTPKPAVEPTNQ